MNLLVVIDSSEASARAIRYLADLFARRRDARFCLTYLMPKVPPALLETGGAEQPLKEEQIEASLRKDQDKWTTSAVEASRKVIRRASAMLRQAGARAHTIGTCQMSSLDNRTTVDELVLVAREQACQTIVVGHAAHSWFGRGGDGRLAEQLVRDAKGFAVWVVD